MAASRKKLNATVPAAIAIPPPLGVVPKHRGQGTAGARGLESRQCLSLGAAALCTEIHVCQRVDRLRKKSASQPSGRRGNALGQFGVRSTDSGYWVVGSRCAETGMELVRLSVAGRTALCQQVSFFCSSSSSVSVDVRVHMGSTVPCGARPPFVAGEPILETACLSDVDGGPDAVLV